MGETQNKLAEFKGRNDVLDEFAMWMAEKIPQNGGMFCIFDLLEEVKNLRGNLDEVFKESENDACQTISIP